MERNKTFKFYIKFLIMRKYLPTLGELIDRLTIVQLKEVKIPEHKEQYQKEIKDIVHDITEILTTTKQLKIDGDFIRQ